MQHVPWNGPLENKEKMINLEDMGRSEICALLDEWIVGRNAERDRHVLKRRLIDGLTYEKLSDETGLSVRHLKTIVYKAEEKLIKHI